MTDAPISSLEASAFTVPTDEPESDGTLEWDSTTLVVVTVTAGRSSGIGWTYGHEATASVIGTDLAKAITGRDPLDIPGAWRAMVAALRNNGRPGISSMAVAAVDIALWDLKAKLLAVPLASLLGRARETVPIYGSGGFTSYSDSRLRTQLSDWVEQGISMVKIKIGRDPGRDPARVRAAREAIGPDVELFVDANGAFTPATAIATSLHLDGEAVSWFEEPVSSDDLAGLGEVRQRAPVGMAIAAGEYGYDLPYFERMLAAGAVDILQADVTRCAGISCLLGVDKLCSARSRPLSLHCSPTLHCNVGACLETLVHLEYFHDHARIETMLFEGVPEPVGGVLRPNEELPGLGIEFRWADAARFSV